MTTRRIAVLGVLVVVALAAVLFWHSHRSFNAGTVDDLRASGVTYKPDQHLFVVAVGDGFIALSDADRHVGARVLYCPLDNTFVGPHGERFDRMGRYLAGPAAGDMGRLAATVTDGEVMVDTSVEPELPDRSNGDSAIGPSPCEGLSEGRPGFYAVPAA